MIKSVVREYKWSPAIVGDLFLDEIDFEGLVFWYKDTKEIEKALKPKKQ
jgi:hypothetical protein